MKKAISVTILIVIFLISIFSFVAILNNSSAQRITFVVESVIYRAKPRLMDLSHVVHYNKEDVIREFGEPNSMSVYYSEADEIYNCTKMIYDDIYIETMLADEEPVDYFEIKTPGKYSFYGLYIGMTREELTENFDSRLKVSPYDNPNNPFDDNEVAYQIDDDWCFAKVILENSKVKELIYMMPND